MENTTTGQMTNMKDWFSLIVMDRDAPVEALLSSPGFDHDNIPLIITLNGVEFTKESLNKIVKEFVDRTIEMEKEELPEIKQRVEYLKTEEGLIEKARELAKEMCYAMAQKFEWGD